MPCRSVGGDFFDYIDMPNGDVRLHRRRHRRQGFAGRPAGGRRPRDVQRRGVSTRPGRRRRSRALNAGLFRRAIEARFLTAFYGILHKDGSLMFTNAGHNPPILVKKNGIRRLEAGGVVLGLFETATFEQETRDARKGRRPAARSAMASPKR